MRSLKGFVDDPEADLRVYGTIHPDPPEPPIDVIGRIRKPEPEDDPDRFGDHRSAVLRVDTQDLKVRRDASGSEAEIQPPFGKMIEKRQPACDKRRVVLLQTHGRRTQPDVPGFAQCRAYEYFGHCDVFVDHGMMLANPEFIDAQFVGANQKFHVFVMALAERLARWVERHDEDTGPDPFHLDTLGVFGA